MYMRYWAGPFRNSSINESGYERYGDPTRPCWLLDALFTLTAPHADLTVRCTRLEHQPESSWDQPTILIMLRATRNCESLPTPLAGQLRLSGVGTVLSRLLFRICGPRMQKTKTAWTLGGSNWIYCVQRYQFARRQILFRWHHSVHPVFKVAWRYKFLLDRFWITGSGSWITGLATASSTSCCLICIPKTSGLYIF